MITETNRQFMETVEMSNIPWDRLMTAYGTAKIFPELFDEILSADIDKINNAIYKMLGGMDHQDTIFQTTPFAMIFLVRILKSSMADGKVDEITKYRMQKLLDVFVTIEESCQYQLELADRQKYDEIEGSVPLFSDMLKEENLLPNDWDAEYEDLPDDFDSYVYYTHGVLVNHKNIIETLSNNNDVKIKKLAEKLYFLVNKSCM